MNKLVVYSNGKKGVGRISRLFVKLERLCAVAMASVAGAPGCGEENIALISRLRESGDGCRRVENFFFLFSPQNTPHIPFFQATESFISQKLRLILPPPPTLILTQDPPPFKWQRLVNDLRS